MQRIRINNIPNQQFTIMLDGVAYRLRLRTIDDYGVQITLADVYVNDKLVKASVRCAPDSPLIPYDYLTVDGANLFFHCINGDYPFYTEFNRTQVLCYGTKEELMELWQSAL